MDNIIRFIYNPFNYNLDYDRVRRKDYYTYGMYKPTRLKSLMIWLMNERIDPIDWEDVPPFSEEQLESGFKKSRTTDIPIYECHTCPNMLRQRDIYVRRVILAFIIYRIHRIVDENLYQIFQHTEGHLFMFSKKSYRIIFFIWIYYSLCKSYVHKDYQMPYN